MDLSRTRHSAAAIGFAFALFLAGCQPDGLATGSTPGAPVSYSIFYSQGDHVEDLVKAGDFAAAAKVFADNPDFFSPDRLKRHRAALTATADGLLAEIRPELAAAKEALDATAPDMTTPARWPEIRVAIVRAQAVLDRLDAVPLLALPDYAPAGAAPLRERLASVKGELVATASATLAASDPAADPGFFAQYPVSLDAPATLAAALEGGLRARLESAAPAAVGTFVAALKTADAISDATKGPIAEIVVAVNARASGAPPGSLRAAMAGISAAKAAGLEPKGGGIRVGFVQATSQTLLRAGQIEFPAEVDIDLPFEARKVDLEKAFEAAEDDYLVVFDVALARINRRVSGMEQIVSRRQVGTRQEPNPEYETARIDVQNAQLEQQQVQMQANMNSLQSMGSPLASLLSGITNMAGLSAARQKLDESIQKLKNTPQRIVVPVIEEYEFKRARVEGSRAMTVNYYVIDRKPGTFLKSSFDVTEREQFRVNYDIDRNDPERERHAADGHTEKEVTDWETAPMKMPMSSLVEDYLKQQAKSQKLVSLAALREDLLRDKNTALARYQTTKIEDSRKTDARMESVVRIFVSNGSGSGFYVTPDLVLTNHHVVENQKLIEMKLSNGLETFGRVEAADVRLDLALVRVQARGKPVRFFDGQRLDLGATVEVIGHPKGYDFSITRGVVSAVRTAASANRVGGKPVLFVQIDAATSPGNSGGPVFMGDSVISVVDWGRVDVGSQNLNFTIHYSEVLEWLREKNVQVVTAR
ncbi:MAG: trypsin-like serine protease [Alphaproteobacteria bacterium]|nr:trypsin-like serine protease [Alphaproteobacteria bacterium]